MASAVAVHIAALTDHSKRLVPGEIGTVAVIAASREQASTVFNYIRGFLTASELLAGQVASIGRDEICLHGDICISVVTNSFRVARGMTLLAVIGDEVSYWRDESSAQPDRRNLIARYCRAWLRRAACGLVFPPAIVVPGCCFRSTASISATTMTTFWW